MKIFEFLIYFSKKNKLFNGLASVRGFGLFIGLSFLFTLNNGYAQMLEGYGVTTATGGQSTNIALRDFRGMDVRYQNSGNWARHWNIPIVATWNISSFSGLPGSYQLFSVISRTDGTIFIGQRMNNTNLIFKINPVTLVAQSSPIIATTGVYQTFIHNNNAGFLYVLTSSGLERWSDAGGATALQKVSFSHTATALVYNHIENSIYLSEIGILKKIQLNADGSFPASIVPTTALTYSGALTEGRDMDISASGREIVLAEEGSPHSATVHRFALSGSSWVYQNRYPIGCYDVPRSNNSQGGVGFVPAFNASNVLTNIGSYVAMSGNAINFSCGNNSYLYGMQITPVAGGTIDNSITVDWDNIFSSIPKDQFWDISTYVKPCAGTASITSQTGSNLCLGSSSTLTTGLPTSSYSFQWSTNVTTATPGVYSVTFSNTIGCPSSV